MPHPPASKDPLLLLIKDDGAHGKEIGTRLMERGCTVFLADTDAEIEMVGDIIDGLIDLSADGRAVLYARCAVGHVGEMRDGEQQAVLCLPADDAAVSEFAAQAKRALRTPRSSRGLDGADAPAGA